MQVIQSLTGKRILFIAPKTFGYEREILSCLEQMGATVDYYNDRPFEDNLRKVVLRLFPFILRRTIASYFQDIVSKSRVTRYDVVFCIKVECFPPEILEKLKYQQRRAEFVFYTWDSFRNNPNALGALRLFDRRYSFDKGDAEAYGLVHRPLFYLNEYADLATTKLNYDAVFIGSVHMHRYQFISKIIAKYSTKYNIFVYQYVPSRWLFYARKILLFPWYGQSKIENFRFEPLRKNEILNVLSHCLCVVDYSHQRQGGLTMRVIEAVGARKKIITNNSSIVEYDFYDPNNILVVDEHDPSIPDEFLTRPYENIPEHVYRHYSIDGWLRDILISIERSSI